MPLSSSAREKGDCIWPAAQLLPGTNEHVIPERDQWVQVTHGGEKWELRGDPFALGPGSLETWDARWAEPESLPPAQPLWTFLMASLSPAWRTACQHIIFKPSSDLLLTLPLPLLFPAPCVQGTRTFLGNRKGWERCQGRCTPASQGRKLPMPIKTGPGTALLWVWGWCFLSTRAHYADVTIHTPGPLLPSAVSDWLHESQWGAHWKAECCPEGAWGFAHPSHLFLHTQRFVYAAVIRTEGYIPPARRNITLEAPCCSR